MAGNADYPSESTFPAIPSNRILTDQLAAFSISDGTRAVLERVISVLVLVFLASLTFGFYALCRMNYSKAEVFFYQAIASIR